MICVEQKYDESKAEKLCVAIKRCMIEAAKTKSEKESVKDVTVHNLNRVEITSPGMLYGGLTIAQIKEGGSKIRNRCIAEVFSRMKIIESWGTGIKRMFSSCKEYGIREPELLEIGDSFRVNLYRPSYNEVHQSSSKSSLKNLNLTQQKIIAMIQDNPKVTQVIMAEEIAISKRAVQKSIKEMVDKGIIERIGAAKGGYWKVRDN